MIEPRRIACRSLAARVADLEGCELGTTVGYMVRDEHVADKDTRIVFATPGLALRDRSLIERADCVILDEFHERGLDADLLLALLIRRPHIRLVIMSATLDGDRICTAARVALAAVAPTVLLVPEAARAIVGTNGDAAALEALQAAASAACKPIDDKRGTKEYRIKVAAVLAKRAARTALERARRG